MSDRLIVPGRPGPNQAHVEQRQTVMGGDGRLYELRVEGTADVERGAIGQFIDLRDRLRVEGKPIPVDICTVLDRLIETPAEDICWE